MSIFDRFFGRESKTLFSQHNTEEVVTISRVNSFKIEFLGKNNRICHDGDGTVFIDRSDDIILNGVYLRLSTVFEANTPYDDPTTIEDITAIHKFKISTAGDREGVRLDVEISDTAVFETLDYLKTHIIYTALDVDTVEDFMDLQA